MPNTHHSLAGFGQANLWNDAGLDSMQVVMFTSDVSARGVDYPDVSLVVQVHTLDFRMALTYVHPQFGPPSMLHSGQCWRHPANPPLCGSPASRGTNLYDSVLDLAGRPCLMFVAQLGLPADKAQYIHRVGRTARAGKRGRSALLLSDFEAPYFLRQLRDVTVTPAPPLPEIAALALQVLDVPTMKRSIFCCPGCCLLISHLSFTG